MLERRQFVANFCQILKINFRERDPRVIDDLSQDPAPGIDDHRMAIGLKTRGTLAELIRSNYKSLIFDRAGAQQRLPMRAACVGGESRGNKNDLGGLGREASVEFGKAQIVADAEAHSTESRFSYNHAFTEFPGRRFPEREAALEVDIK